MSKKITEGNKSKKLNLGQSLDFNWRRGSEKNFGRRFLKDYFVGTCKNDWRILRNITVGREILLTNVGTFGTWCQ